MQPNHLFFYGTLRNDQAHLLFKSIEKKIHYVGEGTISGWLFDLGEYPGAILGDTNQQVKGQIYEILEPIDFAKLDDYEGLFDSPTPEFKRIQVEVITKDEYKVSCHLYVLNYLVDETHLITIADGDYAEYQKRKQRNSKKLVA